MKFASKLYEEAFASAAYTEFLEYNRRSWPEFLLNRGRYEEALEVSRELANSPWAMARVAGRTLAGQALVALNRMNDAQDELHAAEREAESLPPRIAAAIPYPTVLRADILFRENQAQDAEALLIDVEKSILAMPGPDAWSAATFQLETIAQHARDSGDWKLASFTARNMMEHNPSYAGGYYAMALVAQHAHDAPAKQSFASAQSSGPKPIQNFPNSSPFERASAHSLKHLSCKLPYNGVSATPLMIRRTQTIYVTLDPFLSLRHGLHHFDQFLAA
jgi:hypothetical protein